MSGKFAYVCALAACPLLAQVQLQFGPNGTFFSTTPSSNSPAPFFELRADPPTPRASIEAGYLNVTRSIGQAFGIGHRYFYDESAHTYFGYDFVIEPEQQADTWRVTFYDLGIGPLDFQGATQNIPDPTQWKKLSLPSIPPPKVLKASDTLPIEVFVNPNTGQKLVDSMSVLQVSQMVRRTTAQMAQQIQTRFYVASAAMPIRASQPPPTVSGPAREFSAADAEMRILQARVTVNGVLQQGGSMSRLASGPLVWFYVPRRGRYILSLTPRPELGFVQNGEVRGGTIKFKDDNDEILVESPSMIASGDSAYSLYVLHDAEWEPTAQGQGNTLLTGSVSPRELAALSRK